MKFKWKNSYQFQYWRISDGLVEIRAAPSAILTQTATQYLEIKYVFTLFLIFDRFGMDLELIFKSGVDMVEIF